MKRINSLDILRAFGIIFMILGHIITFSGKFDRYIHTFHMPLFFVISGYLYKDKRRTPIYKLVLYKVKRFLLPYVTFAVINYVMWLLIVRIEQKWYEPLIRLFTYNTSGLPISGALWFLTALFWTEVSYLVIDRVFSKAWLRRIIVFGISFITCFILNNTPYRLPLTIDIGIVCVGFYEIGRIFKLDGNCLIDKIKNLRLIKRILLSILLLLANAVLAFVNDYVNIKSGWYGFVPLFWLNALLGIMAYYIISTLIDIKFNQNSIIKRLFILIGRGSIIYMSFNQLLIIIARDVLGFIKNNWIQSIFIFLIVMCILSLLYYFLSKVKCKLVKNIFGL